MQRNQRPRAAFHVRVFSLLICSSDSPQQMDAQGKKTPATSSARSRLLSWCFWLLQLQTSHGFLFPATPFATRSPPVAAAVPPIALAAPGVASETEAGAGAGAGAVSSPTANGRDDGLAGTRTAAPAAAAAGASSESRKLVERRKSGTHRVVLDLRPAADFRRRHLEGSTSIPRDELEPRLLELPPPFAQPVSIVGSVEDLRTASDLLTKKGWQIDTEIGPNLVVPAIDGENPAAAWPTEAGPTSLQVWRANDFLELCTEHFLLPYASVLDADADGTGTGGGVVLDLGCGSGRDTVYMAQNLPPGTRVVGVDNHSYALERGAGLAEQWLENASSRSGRGTRGGDTGDGGSEEGAIASYRGAEVDLEGRGDGTGDADVDGNAKRESPDVRRRACEWLLTDLRKEGSLDGLRACVVHGHRFKFCYPGDFSSGLHFWTRGPRT